MASSWRYWSGGYHSIRCSHQTTQLFERFFDYSVALSALLARSFVTLYPTGAGMPKKEKASARRTNRVPKLARARKRLGDEQVQSRNRLVEEYADFAEIVVARLIRSMHLPHASKDEFLSAAFLGLIEAAGRYDPTRCRDFKGFAYLRMRGAIIDYIRTSCELTGYAYRKFKALEAAQELREASIDSSAPYGAKRNDTSESAAAYLQKIAVAFTLSQEGPKNDDCFEARDPHDPELFLQRKEKLDKIRSIVATLPEKERTIIEQYYFHDMKLSDVAERFAGLSKSWVSRLHDRALEMLREKMSESIEELAA